MKSVAAAFVVINSYKASGDMLGGRERGSGNESAHVGVGFGCGSIQFGGMWGDLRIQDSSPLSLSPIKIVKFKSKSVQIVKFIEIAKPKPIQFVKFIKFIEVV